MNNVVLQVKQTVCRQKLLTPGDSVLVALSGGADSVCLLFVMLELAKEFLLSVSAAHLHHGLRGAEADRDEAFVRDLCTELSVPLFAKRVDVGALAKQERMSVEAAGRKARYAFFESLAQQHHFTKIATAHHANDNVETVLMRILRGTGLGGLGGIPYQNESVIRPMLDVMRKDITAYLTEKGLTWCEDCTNQETEFTRNRIRNELIPVLEQQYNPNFQKGFQEQIRLYAASAAYIRGEAKGLMAQAVSNKADGYQLSCQVLCEKPEILVSTMLHMLLEEMTTNKEIENKHVHALWQMVQSGRGSLSLPDGIVAEASYGSVLVRKNSKPLSFHYSLQNETLIPEAGVKISCHMVDFVPAKKDRHVIYLDMSKIDGKALAVRNRKDGDFFYPTAMGGKKKLQDYFVDEKVPRHLRDSVPMITVDDEIAWICGYRGDRRYQAEAGNTKALCIQLHKEGTL